MIASLRRSCGHSRSWSRPQSLRPPEELNFDPAKGPGRVLERHDGDGKLAEC